MKVSNIIRCVIAVSLFCYACGNPYEVDIPHWDYEDEDDKGENDGNSGDSGTDGKEYPVKYPESSFQISFNLQSAFQFQFSADLFQNCACKLYIRLLPAI